MDIFPKLKSVFLNKTKKLLNKEHQKKRISIIVNCNVYTDVNISSKNSFWFMLPWLKTLILEHGKENKFHSESVCYTNSSVDINVHNGSFQLINNQLRDFNMRRNPATLFTRQPIVVPIHKMENNTTIDGRKFFIDKTEVYTLNIHTPLKITPANEIENPKTPSNRRNALGSRYGIEQYDFERSRHKSLAYLGGVSLFADDKTTERNSTDRVNLDYLLNIGNLNQLRLFYKY